MIYENPRSIVSTEAFSEPAPREIHTRINSFSFDKTRISGSVCARRWMLSTDGETCYEQDERQAHSESALDG